MAAKREIGGAGAKIEHGLAAGQLQRIDGPLAPLLVEPRAEQVIEEVVSVRNRIEHSGNTGRTPSLEAPGIGDQGLGIGQRPA